MQTPESKFLHIFFTQLHAQGIKYAIAREWENLPESLGGSDLDILTGCEADMHKVLNIAEEASAKCNGRALVKYFVEMYAVSFGGRTDGGEWWGAHLDISVGNKYHGFLYFDPRSVMDGRIWDERGFFKVGFGTGVIAFLKELMANGRDRKDYYRKARTDFATSRDMIEAAMIPCFGNNGFNLIREVLTEERDSEYLERIHGKIYRALMAHYIRRHGPVGFVLTKATNYLRRLRRVFRPAGFHVAFVGTDGAGKSTIINAIDAPIYSMLHSNPFYYHLRPGLLPSLSRVMGRPQRKGPVIAPHSGEPSGTIMSIMRFGYYLVDYILGYWCRIFPLLARFGCLVVSDRYYYEYLVDQRRMAVRLPLWLVRVARIFVPEPKVVFCLVGDPIQMHARKPEISLAEVERQVAAWNEFAAKERRAVRIDTTKDLQSTIDDVLQTLVERMSER